MGHVWIDLWKHMHRVEMQAATLLSETPLDDTKLIEVHVLGELFEADGGLHANVLAKAVGREATSFTPILDRLEKRGWIYREADKHDRRAVYIHLTKVGETLRDDVLYVLAELDASFSREFKALVK